MPNLLTQRRVLRPFRPDQIQGLVQWLDAVDASTITFSGSTVSQWSDKSGFSNHATQSASGNQPSGSGSINNLPAITFDGVDDYFNVANSTSINLGPTLSVFIVHKLTSASVDSRRTLIQFSDNATASPWIEVCGATAPGSANSFSYILSRPGSIVTSTGGATISTNPALVGLLIENSANCVIRLNGADAATAASAGATLVGSGATKLIGARTASSQLYGGTMGEILVFNKRLSASEMLQIETYLRTKWGTP